MKEHTSKSNWGWWAAGLAAGATAGLSLTPQGRNALTTALLLFNIIPDCPFRPLDFLTRAPIEEEVKFRLRDGREMSADFYRPSHQKHAAVLLIHGVAALGKRDLRLVNIARTLARDGFTVFVPDFISIKELNIKPSDIDEVKQAFAYLIRDPKIYIHKVGVMGFSYSATLGALLANDRAFRDKVAFVGFFGGFYSAKNMLKYLTTGTFEYDSKTYHRKPDEYSRNVFALNLVKYLKRQSDKEILLKYHKKFEKHQKPSQSDKREFGKLSDDGMAVLNLLLNEDGKRFDELFSMLPGYIKRITDQISLEDEKLDIRARVLIGHGTRDPQMPWTEPQRFYDALPDKKNAHLELLGFFTHVNVKLPPFSFKSLFSFYLPEVRNIFSFVYDFLWQARV